MSKRKRYTLTMTYRLISSIFTLIVVASIFISFKMVELPIVHVSVPAGLLTYPLTFLLSDLVTEVFGAKKAKQMVAIAFAMSILSYSLLCVIPFLPLQDPEMKRALRGYVGLNGWILLASLSAYVTAQVLDIQLYSRIRNWTQGRFLWLRNNGSTCISQMVDTWIVGTIHLYFGMGLEIALVWKIMLFSYTYKAFFSIVTTPLFYLFVFVIRKQKNVVYEPEKAN